MVLAAAFRGPGRLEVGKMQAPGIGSGEVLAEVLAEVGTNAVCGTETRILRGAKARGIGCDVVLFASAAGKAPAQAGPAGGVPLGPEGTAT